MDKHKIVKGQGYELHNCDYTEYLATELRGTEKIAACLVTDPPYSGVVPEDVITYYNWFESWFHKSISVCSINKFCFTQPAYRMPYFVKQLKTVTCSYVEGLFADGSSRDTWLFTSPISGIEELDEDADRENRKKISLIPSPKHPHSRRADKICHILKSLDVVGRKILDPFCGAGSIGCAAIMTGGEYIGFEIDNEYFEEAVTRLQKAEAANE